MLYYLMLLSLTISQYNMILTLTYSTPDNVLITMPTVTVIGHAMFAFYMVFLVSSQFFISALSFATFAVSPELPQNRLQLSFTLLLTSVTFKFVINQSLPKISYLTYMVSGVHVISHSTVSHRSGDNMCYMICNVTV